MGFLFDMDLPCTLYIPSAIYCDVPGSPCRSKTSPDYGPSFLIFNSLLLGIPGLCLVTARSQGGSLETPPRWHATILSFRWIGATDRWFGALLLRIVPIWKCFTFSFLKLMIIQSENVSMHVSIKVLHLLIPIPAVQINVCYINNQRNLYYLCIANKKSDWFAILNGEWYHVSHDFKIQSCQKAVVISQRSMSQRSK